MATIREDLEGTVIAVNVLGEQVSLSAGDEIPEGYWVAGPAVEGGDPNDLRPPWYPTAGEVEVDWDSINGKPASFPPSPHTHVWGDVNEKPTTFPPATHTHTAAQISNASDTGRAVMTAENAEAGRDAVGALGASDTATAAERLATARTIGVTGAVEGSASFDGSANVSIETTGSEG